MRILLIRHGDPDYRNDTLTPKGHAEAKAPADYLKEHEPPTKLFTSPSGGPALPPLTRKRSWG